MSSRTAARVGEAALSQFIQAHSENGICAVDGDDDQSTSTDNGCENLPAGVDPSSQPVHPPGQQPTLPQAAMAHPSFTFTFPTTIVLRVRYRTR